MSRLKQSIETRPLFCLACLFFTWKLLLAVCVIASPGIGYDTSTTLLLRRDIEPSLEIDRLHSVAHDARQQSYSLWKFARWDAIYFLSAIRRDYLYEQEWAFGQGFVKVVSATFKVLKIQESIDNGIKASIALSHLFHLLSVFLVYGLGQKISLRESAHLSFIAGALHIICPAGVFLSAPYSESLFSFLNILGFYLYTVPFRDFERASSTRRNWDVITAGAAFGLACTVRSNGIFSGLILLFDFVLTLITVLREGVSMEMIWRVVSLVLGGCLIATGMIVPQFLAYKLFCTPNASSKPHWCGKTIPSIYSHVQGHYWGNGFFRYWTMSNVPLFVLAAPMLSILTVSTLWAFNPKWLPNALSRRMPQPQVDWHASTLQRLALPQTAITILMVTYSHVQIVTRIASGYPLLYYWLASLLTYNAAKGGKDSSGLPQVIVRFTNNATFFLLLSLSGKAVPMLPTYRQAPVLIQATGRILATRRAFLSVTRLAAFKSASPQPVKPGDSWASALAHNREWATKTAQEHPDLFPNLAKGQHPEILWIGCSDSRCPETLMCGLQPGDVFVHRNIANLVHPADLSINSVLEFAILQLKVKHVVLCGHTSCGGVNAALGNKKLGLIDTWLMPLRALRRANLDVLEKLDQKEAALKLVELSVQNGVKTLRENHVVLDAIQERGLQVHGVVYNVANGLLSEVNVQENDEEKKVRTAAFKTEL
ncbi:MAG: hypothetical protein Q9227_008442 [Pyrenula ochraceoflavens]